MGAAAPWVPMAASPALRVALFGGTFDPVHRGHLAIAGAAREEAKLDRVVFLPCRTSPHKQGDPPPSSGSHRIRMLDLATDGLAWAEVDDRELRRPPPSYSWQTAEEMTRELPEAELHWILGADQWDVLTTWNRAETLRRLLTFIVFPRPPAPPPVARAGWRALFLDTVHPAVASGIRRDISAKAAPHPHLDPAVEAHIRRHTLYADPF